MRKLCLRCDACIGYRLPAYVESQLVEFTSESSSGCFSSRRATQVTGFDVKSLDQGSLVHTNLSLSLSLQLVSLLVHRSPPVSNPNEPQSCRLRAKLFWPQCPPRAYHNSPQPRST
jgi:hypothetical protein